MEELWWILSLLRSLALVVSRYRGYGRATLRTLKEMSDVAGAAAKAASRIVPGRAQRYGGEQGVAVLAMVQVAVVNMVTEMEDGDAMAAGAYAEELAWALTPCEEAPLAALLARLREAEHRSFVTVWAPRARPVTNPFLGA